MKEELQPGNFVRIKGQDPASTLLYMVVNPPGENVPCSVGGMTLVARWYKTELLEKEEGVR